MKMKQIYICLAIFISLAASRFIPHPPNFTSLIALSFYVPAFLGIRYLPVLIVSFAITDFIIGYHTGTHWTWGSVLLIGLMSRYFNNNFNWRLGGAFLGACIFFIVTNFGVWITGNMYQLNLTGLVEAYVMGLPFFGYNILSTLVFSIIIETLFKFKNFNYKKI